MNINSIDDVSIREYCIDDKEYIIHLLRLNTPVFFSPKEEKDLVHYLTNEIEYYYVAEFNNKIIGCGGINLKENKTIGYISWDIIHPKFQGKGIGMLLLDYRIKKIKKNQNINQIIVRTTQLAHKFYEKGGFNLIEIIKDYWAEDFHLYKMNYYPKSN